MGKRLDMARLRAVTDEERTAIKRLTRSRTAPARAVQRAQVMEAALDGAAVEEIAAQLHVARGTV